LALFLYIPFGCSSVSDEEMSRLREETYALEAELAAARQEAAILDRVLTSVYRERDSLVDQINQATAEASGLIPTSQVNSFLKSSQYAQSGQPAQSGLPGQIGPPSQPSQPGQLGQPGQPKVYLAQTGDTLSSIALRFGTTTRALLTLNPQVANRANQLVWVGDEVVLPAD
jgi:LysM repeat protein